MFGQSVEVFLHSGGFPVDSVIKGNFFCVVDDVGVTGPVVSFQSLLNGGHFPKGRRHGLHNESGTSVPEENNSGGLPTDGIFQFSGKENDVKQGLGEVTVDEGETSCPLVDISRHSLVGVRNSGVQIGKLIEDHVI